MEKFKTKSLENLQQRMEETEAGSLRYRVLDAAKRFKTSWIELGQVLYSVYKDKLYKGWGYQKFDTFAAKEIGIRKQTAMKLLRSYFFLEKEEPAYLKQDYTQSSDAASIPTYEAVDVLRMAKNKKLLDEDDYRSIKEDIFSQGKDARQARKDLTQLIRQRQELDPDEAREKKKAGTVKRIVSLLKSLKADAQVLKLLPVEMVKELGELITKIEQQLS